MSDRPTDREIIRTGVQLLQAGLLVSVLPGRLMTIFNITAERAWKLARQALKERNDETGT